MNLRQQFAHMINGSEAADFYFGLTHAISYNMIFESLLVYITWYIVYIFLMHLSTDNPSLCNCIMNHKE